MTTKQTAGAAQGPAPAWVDGNMLAGAMAELFTMDLTVARGRCGHCGREDLIAQSRVFDDTGPGLVARCRGCEEVLLRLVRSPDRARLDLRGLSYLELAVPASV